MKITAIVSDFSREHQTYFRQLMTFIKGYTFSIDVILITDKVGQYASVADDIEVIECETCDSEVIADYLSKGCVHQERLYLIPVFYQEN